MYIIAKKYKEMQGNVNQLRTTITAHSMTATHVGVNPRPESFQSSYVSDCWFKWSFVSLDETRHVDAIYISIDGREKTETATSFHWIFFRKNINININLHIKQIGYRKKIHLFLGL